MKEQKKDPSSLPLPKLVFNYASLKAQLTAEDEEAQARLAEADSEADAEVARKQMAELQGVPSTTDVSTGLCLHHCRCWNIEFSTLFSLSFRMHQIKRWNMTMAVKMKRL